MFCHCSLNQTNVTQMHICGWTSFLSLSANEVIWSMANQQKPNPQPSVKTDWLTDRARKDSQSENSVKWSWVTYRTGRIQCGWLLSRNQRFYQTWLNIGLHFFSYYCYFFQGEQFSMRVNAFLIRNENTKWELHFFVWFTTTTKCQRHNSSVLAINSLHVIFSFKCSLPAERTAVCHFHVGALWKIDKYMTAECYNCDFVIMSFLHIGKKKYG